MDPDFQDQFVTVGELSERVRISIGAIYQRVRRRQLPVRRVGRQIRLPLKECVRILVRDMPAIVSGEGSSNG